MFGLKETEKQLREDVLTVPGGSSAADSLQLDFI